MTNKQAKIALDKCYDAYVAQVQAIAARVMLHTVAPYCDRKGYSFRSGMGTWVFFSPTKAVIDEDTIPKRIMDALNLEATRLDALGLFMTDHEPQ